MPDGPGKALRLTVHPVREHVPIYLAAVGPKNLELTGEIADGWLAIFFSPEQAAQSLDADPRRPARAPGGPEGAELDGFDVVPTVPVVIDDEVERAADSAAGVRRAVRRRHGQP